jgi:hypothetical protein
MNTTCGREEWLDATPHLTHSPHQNNLDQYFGAESLHAIREAPSSGKWLELAREALETSDEA